MAKRELQFGHPVTVRRLWLQVVETAPPHRGGGRGSSTGLKPRTQQNPRVLPYVPELRFVCGRNRSGVVSKLQFQCGKTR